MSYDSVPGPGDPSVPGPTGPSAFPGQTGAPGGQPGPYGQGGPYGAPGVPGYGGPGGPGFAGPGGPPPKKGKGGLIAGLSIAGVVVVALVVLAGVLVFGGDDIDDLPAPKTLGRDPVPAEKAITKKPANCGISKATVKALTPGDDGSTGAECRWSSFGGGGRELDVNFRDPSLGYEKTSGVASAISQFAQATGKDPLNPDAVFKPMTGLGDDAAYFVAPESTGQGVEGKVVFRAADEVVEVTYGSIITVKGSALDALRRGAFRAAADAAKGLGVPANPAVAQVSQAAPVTVPSDVCKLVPEDLMETLGGDDDPFTHEDDYDSMIAGYEIPSATTSGCRTTTFGSGAKDRALAVHIIAPTKPGLDAAVKRTYLGLYYQARADRPTSGGSGRYFAALSDLGDEAFCSYLDGSRDDGLFGTGFEENSALVVVRSGTALITVKFGGDLGDSGLTQQQTINGAYAVAKEVAARLK